MQISVDQKWAGDGVEALRRRQRASREVEGPRAETEAPSAEPQAELEASVWAPRGSHLCLGDGGGAFVLLRQEEADGHEEFVDADAELLLVLAARGQREEAAGLDDVLEDVLAGLGGRGANTQGQARDYNMSSYLDGRGFSDINDIRHTADHRLQVLDASGE